MSIAKPLSTRIQPTEPGQTLYLLILLCQLERGQPCPQRHSLIKDSTSVMSIYSMRNLSVFQTCLTKAGCKIQIVLNSLSLQ